MKTNPHDDPHSNHPFPPVPAQSVPVARFPDLAARRRREQLDKARARKALKEIRESYALRMQQREIVLRRTGQK